MRAALKPETLPSLPKVPQGRLAVAGRRSPCSTVLSHRKRRGHAGDLSCCAAPISLLASGSWLGKLAAAEAFSEGLRRANRDLLCMVQAEALFLAFSFWLGKLAAAEISCNVLRRANRDSLRMVQAEAAMALGDAGGALAHLKAIASRWPASNAVWNLHMRAMAAQVGHVDSSCRMCMLLIGSSAGTEQFTASCSMQLLQARTSICKIQGTLIYSFDS